MSNNKSNQTWIDPNSRALAYLTDRKPASTSSVVSLEKEPQPLISSQKVEANAISRSKEVVLHPEVLPPEQASTVGTPEFSAPRPPMPIAPDNLSDDLLQLEHQVRQMAITLDMNLPEGRLDGWVGRPNHRVAKKTERAVLIAEFEAVRLRQIQNRAEAVRALDQVRYQHFLDRLIAWSNLADQHYRILLAKERVEQERQIAAAKARAEIERYDADGAEHRARASNALREPLPPPQPPNPVDEATLKRQAAQQARKHANEVKLDEMKDEAEFRSDKTTQAIDEILKVFGNPSMRKAARLARILELMDAYQINESVLPSGVRELIEEENQNVDDNL
jgi:hypothetical protein